MKKFIYTTCFLVYLNAGYSQSSLEVPGRLKVSIENVKCINKSWDGFVEFDGHGNEISVTCSYRIYARTNPGVVKKGADGTVIYGSNVNGMTRAGSQTPDLGGINNGDAVNIFKPVIDEHINAGDYIIIAPTVWEWDDPEKNTINGFNNILEADLDWIINQPYPFPDAVINSANPFEGRSFRVYDKYRYGPALKYQPVLKDRCCPGNSQGNRPIGILSGISGNNCLVAYPPPLLVLDTRVLSALYLNNQRALAPRTHREQVKPPLIHGTEMRFAESTYNIQTSNGTYTVFFKIEFIPDVLPSFTPPVPPSNDVSGTPIRIVNTVSNKTVTKTINTSNTTFAVAGKWSGTQTTDAGLYPQNIAFELTTNGMIIIKDINGNIASQGTYTFANNTINGSYKQLSSGETFSFSGSFDAGAGNITGTLGAGANITGQGKWTVTRTN